MARDLMVTSPVMRGEDVLAVQTRLAALGYAPGPIDGGYGPTTAAAVKDFQAGHGLEADGKVGPQTFAALEAGAGSGPGPLRPPSAIGLAALVEAVRQHRRQGGSRPDPTERAFGVWYGENGVPWCNIFVSYCFQGRRRVHDL